MSLIGGGSGGSGGGSGGGSAGKLPDGYEFKKNQITGGLELWKGTEKIAEQNTDGSWFKTAVSTGVGSLHLGGGDSSDPAHSLSSIGQNCGFKNEAFNATPESAIVWFPSWQGLSSDLSAEMPATFLQFGSVQAAFAPNGIAQAAGTAFDFTATMTANICVAAITCQADEAYSGKITNIIMSNPKGVELHVSSSTINVTAGQEFTINYPSLYFARQGDQLRLIMRKENGQALQVKRGTMNSNPWRTLRVRTFEDVPLKLKPKQVNASASLSAGDVAHVDVSSVAVTCTLPSTPVKGDSIIVAHVAGDIAARQITVARNGKNIMGLAEDLAINIADASVEFIYNGAEWRINF